mmetsp:Transcript_19871/g.14313  ORF Transcript_19871/g.14313 Transcript_19871/m.14313 type:complete len:117 (-) Transcript_19871:791-1141(-)
MIGICSIYTSVSACFFLALVATIIQGSACALGESTLLGFLKGFPNHTVGYFSSGTGGAGLCGTLMILGLNAAGIGEAGIFFIAAPTVIPYFLSFVYLNNLRRKYQYVPEKDVQEGN